MKIDHVKMFNKIRGTQTEFNFTTYSQYIKDIGIKNLKPIHLDFLFETDKKVISYEGYKEYYAIASANESGNIMKWWTIAIGIMTIVMTAATLFSLYLALT